MLKVYLKIFGFFDKMIFRAVFIFIIIFLFVFPNILAYNTARDSKWTLRILHTNDMHSRYEQTSAISTTCESEDVEANKCYGGFARIATLIREAKNSSIPTLFLNAGDTYVGSPWFVVHRWKIASKFLNLLKPDVASLGNHEFDEGPMGLYPYVKKATFPIVACNLDFTDEPELASIKKSTILKIDGRKIGVIGYLTPDTKFYSTTGNVIFYDEVECIRKEVKKLQAEGVNIIIALGHSGFIVDKRIAAEVEDLDLVIGGHTNTFLYNGNKPDLEEPGGPYPIKITQKNGRIVYVVQAYAYTKYLGDISMDFDAKGEVKKILGDPILVNSSIKQAEDILDELEKWRPALKNVSNTVVGYSKVLLEGSRKECRRRECNFGNLILDSMIDYNAKLYNGSNGWTDSAAALINSGAISNSINKAPDMPITLADVLTVLPFTQVIGKINITGNHLLQAFEYSVSALVINDTTNLESRFLQFSGIKIVYNLFKPIGSRVVSVYIRCAKCRVPKYTKMRKHETYTIIITNFLHGGGNEYHIFKQFNFISLGITVSQSLVEYLKHNSPVYPGVEDRIKFKHKIGLMADQSNSADDVVVSITLILVVFISFIFT